MARGLRRSRHRRQSPSSRACRRTARRRHHYPAQQQRHRSDGRSFDGGRCGGDEPLMSPATIAAFATALLSAALMGMAIQRGATCMVAAVDEAISARRYTRALALGEAALWVGGLIALAQLAGGIAMPPA